MLDFWSILWRQASLQIWLTVLSTQCKKLSNYFYVCIRIEVWFLWLYPCRPYLPGIKHGMLCSYKLSMSCWITAAGWWFYSREKNHRLCSCNPKQSYLWSVFKLTMLWHLRSFETYENLSLFIFFLKIWKRS